MATKREKRPDYFNYFDQPAFPSKHGPGLTKFEFFCAIAFHAMCQKCEFDERPDFIVNKCIDRAAKMMEQFEPQD